MSGPLQMDLCGPLGGDLTVATSVESSHASGHSTMLFTCARTFLAPRRRDASFRERKEMKARDIRSRSRSPVRPAAGPAYLKYDLIACRVDPQRRPVNFIPHSSKKDASTSNPPSLRTFTPPSQHSLHCAVYVRASPPANPLGQIMNPALPRRRPGTDGTAAAWRPSGGT